MGRVRTVSDACPTGAIIQPYVVDGSKCISYFTIELKGAIPEPMAGNLIIGSLVVMYAKRFVLGTGTQLLLQKKNLIRTLDYLR